MNKYMRAATPEERQLGLDPSKYTKKLWRPQDYTSSATAEQLAASQQYVDELKREQELAKEQADVFADLGPDSPMEMQLEFRKRLLGGALTPAEEALIDNGSPSQEDEQRAKEMGFQIQSLFPKYGE